MELLTRAMFEKSLHFKAQHLDFKSEMSVLSAPKITWDFETANERASFIILPLTSALAFLVLSLSKLDFHP